MSLPFAPRTLMRLAKEARVGAARPVVLGGARELQGALARGLAAGGSQSLVRENGGVEGAAVLVWLGEPDEDRLRAAFRARVPIIAVTEADSVPYVLDTSIVRVERGSGLPVEAVAAKIAHILGDDGAALGAALPVLREPVLDEMIRRASVRNATIAAAVWIPGVDFPILTLNQLRLVLRIAGVYGHEVGTALLPEAAGVVGAAYGFRAAARRITSVVRVGTFATRGAVAFAGTRAVGEAARRRFAIDPK
ncbi:MAG: hypothetical protein F2663_07460 [Actinobacteria bacterium]|uniref:Unannotated protein n=1 Tax=freshwater metagenome TaxID=449393 RepID=A0A6J6PXY9_9ZZZZ|nr:hypothetical protein [Actinomycetota bacterium]